jgi:hypothetical protein
MGKSCIYNGAEYSDGAVVCQNGSEYLCNDGSWEPLGTSCGNRVDKEGNVSEERKSGEEVLPCITFFAAPGMKLGIRNGCAQCKVAVVSWVPAVGIRRYRVEAYSQIIVDILDQTGQLIGEDPC